MRVLPHVTGSCPPEIIKVSRCSNNVKDFLFQYLAPHLTELKQSLTHTSL